MPPLWSGRRHQPEREGPVPGESGSKLPSSSKAGQAPALPRQGSTRMDRPVISKWADHQARSRSSSMSAWVQGRGLVRWQWSSMARRAYSAIRSRSRPVDLAEAAGQGEAGQDQLGQGDQVRGPSPLRPRPSRAARSASRGSGRLAVEPQGVRQQDRVERAVMRPPLGPQGVRERVDHAQPLVEADPARARRPSSRRRGPRRPSRRAPPPPAPGRRAAGPPARSRRRSGGTWSRGSSRCSA